VPGQVASRFAAGLIRTRVDARLIAFATTKIGKA
jgi:hypothetical protein